MPTDTDRKWNYLVTKEIIEAIYKTITCCQGQQHEIRGFIEDIRKLSHRQQEIDLLVARGNN